MTELRVIAKRLVLVFSVLLPLLVGLPLVGVVLAGKPLGRYLEFPPLTHYVDHAPFAWPVFVGLALFVLVVLAPFVVTVITAPRHRPVHPRPGRFPWWGWLGVLILAAAWVLAWTRFAWFKDYQLFTFSPLWFGYILVVNGWTRRRSGRCMATDRFWGWLALFFLSAVFWWFFEYLNRFVQNWYYAGVGEITPWEYFVFASLPFSTVLPAVLGTRDLLVTFPALGRGLDKGPRIVVRRPRALAWVVLAVAAAGLAGIGIWPNALYPLLWVAPLGIISAVQALIGEATVFAETARGDWRPIWYAAVAALVCGFFWELWNYYSLAKWVYAVPYVTRFKLFEMPVLGYAGYLPFGLECVAVAALLRAKVSR